MSSPEITIEQVCEVTDEVVEAFSRLIPQLSSHRVDADGLHKVVGGPGNVLLCARDSDGSIVGTLCLVTYHLATGEKAWIEDVVVDATARGKGVGEALVHEALRIAKKRGIRAVDLTSRPSREDANRLYERVGFARRETNVWRFETNTVPD